MTALLALAASTAACLTKADDQGPNGAQANPGQFNNPAQYGMSQYGAPMGAAQPGQNAPAAQPNQAPAMPGMAMPGVAQPAAQPQQAPQAGPAFPSLPQFQLPGFPGAAQPNGAHPQQGGAQPAPAAQPSILPGAPMGNTGGSTGGATPIDPNLASVATVPLMAYALQEAPNMGREGNIIAGQFREGQTLEQPFMLQPNKCYTVLAVGAGPQEVDISLVAVTPIPAASPVLASDSTTGPNAALGGRGNCYKWQAPIGINAKYVVRATRGMGVIAAQLYSK